MNHWLMSVLVRMRLIVIPGKIMAVSMMNIVHVNMVVHHAVMRMLMFMPLG